MSETLLSMTFPLLFFESSMAKQAAHTSEGSCMIMLKLERLGKFFMYINCSYIDCALYTVQILFQRNHK